MLKVSELPLATEYQVFIIFYERKYFEDIFAENILRMFDWHQPLPTGLQSPGQGGRDGEDSSLGEGRTDGLWADAAWKSKALVKTLRGETPSVRGLLLVFGLHDDVVVHGLDHQLLWLEVFHVDQYFVLVILIHHPSSSVLIIEKAGSGSLPVVKESGPALSRAIENASVS